MEQWWNFVTNPKKHQTKTSEDSKHKTYAKPINEGITLAWLKPGAKGWTLKWSQQEHKPALMNDYELQNTQEVVKNVINLNELNKLGLFDKVNT